MARFGCGTCDADLTVPVSRVALPAHAHLCYGRDLLAAVMEPGTYAIHPTHIGPPWRRWEELTAGEAEALGWFAPVFLVPAGPRGAVAVAPGDMSGTVILQRPIDGRNLACARCATPVGVRFEDCSHLSEVWLHPPAVRHVDDDAADLPVIGWEELRLRRPGVPPVDHTGWWDQRWTATVAAALAHLLAASAGARLAIPDGLTADTFRPLLNRVLPAGPEARSMTIAGPGLPAVTTDIALVPQHPQTGEPWRPPSGADVVGLDWDVWMYLAHHREHRSFPATGTMPIQAWRDDQPPPGPSCGFRPNFLVFNSTLARLPEVRLPWLREIHDRVRTCPPW